MRRSRRADRYGARIVGGHVDDLSPDGAGFRLVADGVKPHAVLAISAGARQADNGRLCVDDHQETSVPGLYAAGDIVCGLNQISTAEGEGAVAATGVHNARRTER